MSALPEYSPAAPAPSYSRHSGPSEISLSFTPPQRSATSIFTHSSQIGTLFLNEQEEGCAQPSYGPHLSKITGELAIAGPEFVLSVVLKITGSMDIYTASSFRVTHLLDQTEVLWNQTTTSHSSDVCPGLLAIAHRLPESWQEGDKEYPLPPSFYLPIAKASDTSIKIEYSMEIEVTSVMHRRISFLTTTKSTHVPFIYERRARPWRAYLDSPAPLSTLKSNPEEWMTVSKILSPRPGAPATPLEFILLIPSIQVYCATDTIPFHVQLLGSEKSVKGLFSPHSSSHTTKPVVRLALVRQIDLNIDGMKSWRNVILDEASFHSVPSSYPEDTHTHVLNWNGTMHPKGIDVGSFGTSGVSVKDLIVLSVAPPSPESPFGPTQHHHPIRLVTLPHVESN